MGREHETTYYYMGRLTRWMGVHAVAVCRDTSDTYKRKQMLRRMLAEEVE